MRTTLKFPSIFALMSALVLSAPAFAVEYEIDPVHSNVDFTVRHLLSKVRGQFKKFDGTFYFNEKDAKKSWAKMRIDASSIDTNDEKRDAHLKSEDFFYVEKYPTITFNSKKVEKVEKNQYKVHGDMTIRGKTRPVTFNVEYLGQMKGTQGEDVIAFTADSRIDRKEFDINWQKVLDTGGVVVGDEVDLRLQVEARPKALASKAAAKTAEKEAQKANKKR